MLKLAGALMNEDVDIQRADGSPTTGEELLGVVSAEGKTRAQVIQAVERLVQHLPNVIVTRADAGNDDTHRRQAELDSQNMQAIIVVGDGKSTLSLLARQIVGVPVVVVPTSSDYGEAATDPLPENFSAEAAELTVVNFNDGVRA